MSSRTPASGSGLARALAFSLALCAAGCAKFGLHESVMPREPMQLKAGNTGCLSDAGTRIGAFLQGTGDSADIEAMFACADESLQLFLDRTKTNTPGIYQPVELRNFFEKYFIGGNMISNGLLAETMEFKRSILGGRGDILTADELRNMRRVLAGFRDQLLSLSAFRPLTLERLSGLPRAEQDIVIGAISVGLVRFGELLSQTAGDYSTDRLEALLVEFERSFPGEGLRKVISRIPLIRSIKPVLMGTSPEQFRGEEWPRMLGTLVDILGIYIRSHPILPEQLGLLTGSSVCGSSREKIADAGTALFALLEKAVRYHGGLEMIPFVELDKVIDSFLPGDLGSVRPATVKKFIRPFFRRFLAGLNPGVLGREAEGLTLVALERARRAFLDWSDNQRYLEGVFVQLSGASCLDGGLRGRYSWAEIEEVPVEAAMGVARPEALSLRTQATLQVFRRVISRQLPLQGAAGMKLEIDALHPTRRHSFNSLSNINWLSLGYVLAQQGYRETRNDPVRRAGGDMNAMTEPEIDAMFKDIFDLGVDLEILYPETGDDGGSTRFRDGNLFTYSGNGNTLLEINEGIEVLALLVSSKDSSAAIHEAMSNGCPSMPGGVFGTRLVEVECYKKRLGAEYSKHFSHLPGLVAYLDRLPSEGRVEFIDKLFEIARGNPMVGYLELRDSDVIAALPHFVETFYRILDRDRSGLIETEEALVGFDRFEATIKSLVNDPSFKRKDLVAVYTYLLDRGAPPVTAGEKMGFVLWKLRGPGSWDLSVGRRRLLDIFAALSRK